MEQTIERLGPYTASQVTQARALDYVRCLSLLHEGGGSLAERFVERYPHSFNRGMFTKAAIAPGTPSNATWGGPLAVAQPLKTDFVALVRAATLIKRIPGLRIVPFNVSVPVVTSGGSYGWVGAGKVTPVGALALSTAQIGTSKASGILVVTNAATDINALIRAFVLANPDVASAVIVMSPANAVALAATGNYKDLTLSGGFIAGVPVVTSAAAGTNVVMLDPSGILAALQDIEIDIATDATVELEAPPTDPSTAATVQVSLWSLNLVGLKVVAFANWKVARASAVQYISGASWA